MSAVETSICKFLGHLGKTLPSLLDEFISLFKPGASAGRIRALILCFFCYGGHARFGDNVCNRIDLEGLLCLSPVFRTHIRKTRELVKTYESVSQSVSQ